MLSQPKNVKKTSYHSFSRTMYLSQIKELRELFHVSIRHFYKNEYIRIDKSSSINMYILFSGSLQLIKEDFNGNRNILGILKEGYIISEEFVDKKYYHSIINLQAMTDASILILPVSELDMRKKPIHVPLENILMNFLYIMSDEKEELIAKINILSEKTVKDKILAYLSKLAEENQSNTFKLPFSKTDLADYLNINRSSLERELSKMKKTKLIKCNGRTYTLKPKLKS